MKWMGKHLFEGRVNTGDISETGLDNQCVCEFRINRMVVSCETLFRTLDSSHEGTLHFALIEHVLYWLLEGCAKHFSQYSTKCIGQDRFDHDSPLSVSLPL